MGHKIRPNLLFKPMATSQLGDSRAWLSHISSGAHIPLKSQGIQPYLFSALILEKMKSILGTHMQLCISKQSVVI